MTESCRVCILVVLVVTLPLMAVRDLWFSSMCLSYSFLVAVMELSQSRYLFSCFSLADFWFARISNNSLWSISSAGSSGSPLATIVAAGVSLPVGVRFVHDLVFRGIPLLINQCEVFCSQQGRTNIKKCLVSFIDVSCV